ncbi:ArsR/SmtB family transcription factor [Virgibacillus oceani]
MERNLFTAAFPETKLNTEHSLGINLMTNIQLADYFINSSTYPSEWIKRFSNELHPTVIADLKLLRTVFAHGVILRDFYICKQPNVNQNWEQFIGWWKGLSKEEVLELIIYGIRETMDYYFKYLSPMPTVERTMERVSLDEEKLRDSLNRRQALRAVLQSWSVDDIKETLPLYEDTGLIKNRMVRLLEGFWQSGFKDLWTRESERLSDWQSENKELVFKSYPTNVEAIFEVTGLYPDTNELDKVNRAKELLFIPVTNLGRLIVLYHSNEQLYVMFEPGIRNSKKESWVGKEKLSEFYSLFEGLGDKTRLQMIELIDENKEMFAQQIVQKLGMKQSTVSRHLNQLHQSGIVNIRQEGTTKYFSINKKEFRRVSKFLDTILKS